MPLTPADLSTLSRLLDDAMDLAPAQVDDWLAALPDAQQHLIPSLRAMLAQRASADGDDFMASGPSLEGVDASVAHEGDLVGAYRLIREIGHGGMGAVWLAERADGTLKRKVALKLPRLAWGAGLAERMARERDIGALLEHPNIARLYDAGVDDKGRPFLALEYIDGVALDVWCETKALSIRERLGLFLQVAHAVAYAHGRLVVHRDLKPSNVLVTADGQAHLLDFGIAKLLDDASAGSNLTQEQGRVLTPRYASPEQIAGETITVASDVYSLGVLLYEMLAGTSPYETTRRTAAAIEDAILTGEHVLASSKANSTVVAKQLRGDIDAILGHSIKRNTGDRYASVDAMITDVERHLAGDPVKARPDSVAYRWRKTLFRHRIAFTAAASVFLAMLVGGSIALSQAHRATQQAERARLATEFVSEMFRVNSQPTKVLPQASQDAPSAFLDQGAQLISVRFVDQPDMQAELYGAVGRIYADIGASRSAIELASQELQTLDKLPEDASRKAKAFLLLADAQLREERFEAAQRSALQAAQLGRNEDTVWLNAMAIVVATKIEAAKFDEARSAQQTAERDPAANRSVASSGMARLRATKARLLMQEKRIEEGLSTFDKAIELALQSEGSLSRTAVDIRIVSARFLNVYGRSDEGKVRVNQALATLRTRGGADDVRAAVVAAEFEMGLYENGEVSRPEALAVIDQSRAFVAAQTSPIPANVKAKLDFALGTIYLNWTDVRLAREWIERSAPVLQSSDLGPRDRFAYSVEAARLAEFLGQHDKADHLWRDSLEITVKSKDTSNPASSQGWVRTALNLSMKGDFDAAEALLDAAPTWADDASNPIDFRNSVPLAKVRVALDRGDFSRGVSLLPDLASVRMPKRSWYQSTVFAVYGEALCAAGRFGEGLPLLLDAVAIDDTPEVYPADPDLARLKGVAGLCALRGGDRAKAMELGQSARAAFQLRPEIGTYFKRPSLRLDEALAHQKVG